MADTQITNNIPKALNDAAAGNMKSAEELQRLYGQIGTNYAQAAAMKGTVGDSVDTPLTIRTRSLAELEAQSRTQELAAEAGFSPDMSSDIQAILLRDIRETTMKARDVAKKLAEDKSVSLFDDPLTAIGNAFTIPWDEQALEGLVQQKEVSVKSLNEITAGVTNAAATSKLIASKVTEASIADQTTAIENTMKAQRLQGEAKALEANIQGVKAAMESTDKQLAYSLELDKWKKGEEAQSWMREQRSYFREKRTLELNAMKDQELADKERLRFANAALAEAGLPQFATVGQIKSRMLMAPKEKARIEDLISRGAIIADGSTRRFYTHGDNVYETLKFWTDNNIQPRTPDERAIMQIVRDAAAAGEQAGKPGSPATRDQAAQKFLKETLGTLEKVKKDDDSNPLRPPTLGTMASSAVANNPVFQKVIAPQITDGNKNITAHPEIVFPMIADAVSAGKIKPAEAATFIADFYKRAAKINTENLKLDTKTGYAQTTVKSDITIGVNPVIKGVSDVIMATGAATSAAGLTAIPGIVTAPAGVATFGLGAAIAGVGAAGNIYANRQATMKNVDWTDPVMIRQALIRKVAADRGVPIIETDFAPPPATKAPIIDTETKNSTARG